MSLSRLVPRILVLGAVALVLFACATTDRGHVRRVANSSVIVDVYVAGSCAVPEASELHVNARSRKGHDGGHLPSVINWIGPPHQKLQIEWKDPKQKGMHKEIICMGTRCQAITNIDFREAPRARAEYRVWIEGVTQPCDPVVIVDNCCDN